MRRPEVRTYYTEYLRQRKLRATSERFAVLDAVLAWRGHFDADRLYIKMKTDGGTVSRATVYSALETMRAGGILTRYRFAGRTASYELAYGVPRHHHIVCTVCGRIEEFTDPRVDRLARHAAATLDHRLEDAVLHMYGVCPSCLTP
jgi:Fur family ferric uptake transcriptional regulator